MMPPCCRILRVTRDRAATAHPQLPSLLPQLPSPLLLAALALATAILFPALGPAPAQAAFPLAGGGRAAPVLVVRDAPERVNEAVDDLLHYVELATGTRPELRRVTGPVRPGSVEGPAVLVGAASGLEVSRRQAGYDGYRLVITHQLIRLAGPGPEGTANAVYDLLEHALGVRFLVPGDDGAVVPTQRAVRVSESDRTERPAFDQRYPWFNQAVLADYPTERRRELRRFIRRNRGMGMKVITGHYFDQLIPADEYFDEHPDYFAEVQGERHRSGQLCTSHPSVTHLAVEHWAERFAREPELQIGSLTPNDGGLYCECENCRLTGTDLAGRLIGFMNEVTRRLSRRHPDRQLTFYAYGPLTDPTGLPLHPNLIANVTRYNICQAHTIDNAACSSNRLFHERLTGWRRDSQQLLVREYSCWWHLPDLAFDVLAGNLRTYQSMDVLGISREYLRRGFGSDLLRYVDLQLMWDPSEDPDRLIDLFLDGRFGSAAGGMRRVIDRFRVLLENTEPAQLVRGNETEIAKVYRTSTLKSAVADLERLAEATPGVHGERVSIEADMLRAALDFRRLSEMRQRYSITGRREDLEQLQRKMDEAEELFDRLEAAGTLGSSFANDLASLRQQVEGSGFDEPIDGAFEYHDDMAHGGFSRRDAERIEGFYPGQYGLALLPGKTGRVAYKLTAAPGKRFEGAELRRLVFRGSSSRIEIRTERGVEVFSDNTTYNDMQYTYDLTPMIADTERFTIIFWASNRGERPLLCLDNWGIRATTR